jgi:hypothetical protein
MRKDLIESLAETLEGIAVGIPGGEASANPTEASILLFHPREAAAPESRLREVPLLELNLFETGRTNDGPERFSVILQSALGMIEMHDVDEIRLLDMTNEAAFVSRNGNKLSLLTLSSHGVIQSYTNIEASLAEREISEIDEADLRAGVALKMFMENAQVFSLQSA